MFYSEATKDVDKTVDPDAIYVTDLEGGKDLVMATAAFGKARELMTWLEFWVYMCTDGTMPPTSDYMTDEDDMGDCVPSDLVMKWTPKAAGRRKSTKKVAKKHS